MKWSESKSRKWNGQKWSESWNGQKANQENGRNKSVLTSKFSNEIIQNHHHKSNFGAKTYVTNHEKSQFFLSSKVCNKIIEDIYCESEYGQKKTMKQIKKMVDKKLNLSSAFCNEIIKKFDCKWEYGHDLI